MSKIKVDEVESGSSNVKLSPKGTGLVKVSRWWCRWYITVKFFWRI